MDLMWELALLCSEGFNVLLVRRSVRGWVGGDLWSHLKGIGDAATAQLVTCF